MTDEQINAAIAEACGDFACKYCQANYCNDLNSMHEAEGKQSRGTIYKIEAQLKQMVGSVCFRATARQRAEAFLRTLGKWEEAQG